MKLMKFLHCQLRIAVFKIRCAFRRINNRRLEIELTNLRYIEVVKAHEVLHLARKTYYQAKFADEPIKTDMQNWAKEAYLTAYNDLNAYNNLDDFSLLPIEKRKEVEEILKSPKYPLI